MEARLELARRYLHVFGTATPEAFAEWAGIGPAQGRAAFDALGATLSPVGTGGPTAAARLLPSGDTYYLLQGADRELLLPDADRRRALWTSRVWSGAGLARGEVVGTWRRAGAVVTVQSWRRLPRGHRAAVEAEAESLPLPDLAGQIHTRWER